MPTELTRCSLRLRGSRLGPESPWPQFTALRDLPPLAVAEAAGTDQTVSGSAGSEQVVAMQARMAAGRLDSPLPYAVQGDYDRADTDLEVSALVLDNGELRATVLPGLGGRVWSLFDQVADRELLFVNPVLRFANFGLTNAWFAGGIEWNLGATGHSPQSCRPMHATLVRDADSEPVLRLTEWERIRDLTWQIDLRLAGRRLLVSTRISNPDPIPKPLYWWTNIAVPETEHTRVLCPADSAWMTNYAGALTRTEVPGHPDLTRPRDSAQAADLFFELAPGEQPIIASVEPDGRGFVQASTAELIGRKLFCWGDGVGGRQWQEWLCGPDARYAEIQAGRCRTQVEYDTLGAGETIEWTEVFGALELDPELVAGDFRAAGRAAAFSAPSAHWLTERHTAWQREVRDAEPEQRLADGSGWGAVELRLRGRQPDPLLGFEPADDASRAVAARMDGEGQRAGIDVPLLPGVSPLWRELIRQWAGQAPEQWWPRYALGVHAQLDGDLVAAERHYRASLAVRDTAVARRCLALLLAGTGRGAAAVAQYAAARALLPGDRMLLVESVAQLLAMDRARAAVDLLAGQPAEVRRHGRLRLLEARALGMLGETDLADSLLAGLVVPDLAEGSGAIRDVWDVVHPGRSLPAVLDFSMTGPGMRPDTMEGEARA